MTNEELNKIRDDISFQMISEQNTGYKNEYSNSLKQKINLYNYVIDLRQALDKVKDKLICFGEALDSMSYQQLQKECLLIIDNVLGEEKC